jgi:hypothetical protein
MVALTFPDGARRDYPGLRPARPATTANVSANAFTRPESRNGRARGIA